MPFSKINLKWFATLKDSLEIRDFFSIFQSWIQQRALKELLIDVADYAHVPEGPGIVLVGHEANYATDQEDGRFGLLYSCKQSPPRTAQKQLVAAFHASLTACSLLETDPALKGNLTFQTNEVLFILNDRLLAPNTEATQQMVEPLLRPLLSKLWGDTDISLTRDPNPKHRFNLTIKAQTTQKPISALLTALD